MKSLNRTTRALLATVALSVIAGCGLATSNEERVKSAAEDVDAGQYRAAMIKLKNVLGSDANDASARLLLAKVSLGLGDVLTAEKELARAAEIGAEEAEVLPLHLDILLAKGQFTEVLAALGMDSTGLTVGQKLSYRGEALLGLGNSVTAQATYNEWLELEPESVDAKVGLASALAIGNDLDAADEVLSELVGIETVPVLQATGIVKYRLGEIEVAESAFDRAATVIRPQAEVIRYASILASLTETRLMLREFEAAHLSLDRLSGISPGSPMTLMLAARLARAENDYAVASRHLQALLNVSPDNRQAQLFLANMQMMQGNFAQAESLLQRVVATSPDNLQARKMLAQVQLQRSEPQGAVEALAPLLGGNSEDADLHTLLAQANMQQGDTQSAIKSFREAVELAPDSAEARLNLASAYVDANEANLALEVLEQVPEGAGVMFRRERLLMRALSMSGQAQAADAIASDLLARSGSQVTAAAVAAGYYLETGREDIARRVLRELVVAHPEALGAKNALATLEFAEGNTDRAEALLQSVIEIDGNNLAALLGLARVADRAGEKDEKERLLLQAASGHPKALAPRVLLAREYLQTGDISSAERYANELVSIGFTHPVISEVVGQVFLEAGRDEEALQQFQMAAQLDTGSARIQLGLARAFLALEQTVEARQALSDALAIEPAWPPALSLLILVELRQGQLDDAWRTVAEFRQAHPGDVSGMVLEGEVLLYQQKFAEAAAAFRRAVGAGAGRPALLREYQALVDGAQPGQKAVLEHWLAENPNDTLARSFLAQHLLREGGNSAAAREYKTILESDPDNAAILNNLAWVEQQEGNLERAVELAEKAWTLDAESGSMADTLGWIYRDLGQLEKSRELLRDAVRLSPSNGEILYHYAVVLSETGGEQEAREILTDLTNNDTQFPSRELADDLLGEL